MSSNYAEMAQRVVRNYLRSAVVIDDEWPVESDISPKNSELPDESELVDETSDNVASPTDEPDLPPDPSAVHSGGSISYAEKTGQRIGDSRLFSIRDEAMHQGLIACGLRYNGSASYNEAVQLARNADILFLDWHLVREDYGEASIRLLRALSESGGLAFVCIFTDEPKSGDVRKKLIEALKNGNNKCQEEDSTKNFRIGNLIFVVRNKPWTTFTAGDGDMITQVEPRQLLKAAIIGIIEVHSGLLQLAMMEMTAKHREHLPEILDLVEPVLDPILLGETRLSRSPVSKPTGAFLAALIDEWKARLEAAEEDLKMLGQEGLSAYREKLGSNVSHFDDEKLKSTLVRAGVDEHKASSIAESWDKSKQNLKLERWMREKIEESPPFPPGLSINKRQNEAFVNEILFELDPCDKGDVIRAEAYLRLDAFFHQQRLMSPRVTQGTILRVVPSKTNGFSSRHYLICTTPACDAEKPVSQDNVYTFVAAIPVPLEVAQTRKHRGNPSYPGLSETPFYCVIREGTTVLLLMAYEKRPVSIRLMESEITNGQSIFAHIYYGEQEEETGKEWPQIELVPVAQLRFEMALKLSADTTRHASRVGVSRLEALRKGIEG